MLSLNRKENSIHMHLDLFLINRSDLTINLFILATTIKKQVEAVYTGVFGNIELNTTVTVQPLYKFTLRSLYNKPVIAISSKITNDNIAEADFRGMLIKLNPKNIESLISGANKRTLPHELGHIFGLEHPHANARFESVNTNASLREQNITNEEKKYNLMCQGWYIQKAGIDLNAALSLTQGQVELIYENYSLKKLSNNYHIKRGFLNYKWIGEI